MLWNKQLEVSKMITQIITIAIGAIVGGFIGYILTRLWILKRLNKALTEYIKALKAELDKRDETIELWLDRCLDLELEKCNESEYPDLSDIEPEVLNINNQ